MPKPATLGAITTKLKDDLNLFAGLGDRLEIYKNKRNAIAHDIWRDWCSGLSAVDIVGLRSFLAEFIDETRELRQIVTCLQGCCAAAMAIESNEGAVPKDVKAPLDRADMGRAIKAFVKHLAQNGEPNGNADTPARFHGKTASA
jgi:hypothetical protein